MSLYHIGVDVGGTNTDAAILDIKDADGPERGVLASHKASTTEDITSGIEDAIRAVLSDSGVDSRRVFSVTIGTTHFINALVEADARRLDKVAVVRLCGPFTRQIPPFSDFPRGLRTILDGNVYYLDGGFEIDGREIAPLNHEQVRTTAREIVASGVKSVAVVGVFSPFDHEGLHEEKCKDLLLQEAPDLRVVCSHDIGPTGFLERENATILNAAILRTASNVTKSFKTAMARLRLSCPFYLSQNDGTLIEADAAADYPIKTFASGPTNSMTGAAFLAGLDQRKSIIPNESSDEEPQILVVDIGGTTTDVCALLPSGFPRQAPGFVEVGGVRTAFSMPEVVSVGLGGGSKVFVDPSNDEVTLGPASVGHFLQQDARVFGGNTLTSTDVVVALGKAQLGNPALVNDLSPSLVDKARKEMNRMLESVIEQMKVSPAPIHILLVGGGSILVTEELKGVAKCIRPIHQGAANAVGAAIAKVSGDIDTVELLGDRTEDEVVQSVCQKARDLAVSKGATSNQVKVMEINKIPLPYKDSKAIRIQVRAVGPLLIPHELTPPVSPKLSGLKEELHEDEGQKVSVPNALEPTTRPSQMVDLDQYRPDVRCGTWYVSEIDLELIATGCGVLGTGGGGPTHHEYLSALHVLRTSDKGRMRIVSPDALKDTDHCYFGSWYGSPSVATERIAGGNELIIGMKAMKQVKGGTKMAGIFIDEIGGGNGMSAFPAGVHFDVPVIDGDAMGRAYPTMYHAIFSVYGHSLTPCLLSDARGNTSIVMNTDTPQRLEKMLRDAAIELGLCCAICANPLPGSVIKEYGIPNTLSLAWYLGRAMHNARKYKQSHTETIFKVCAGKILYTGKIVNVNRFIGGGYTMGTVIIGPDYDEASTKDGNTIDESYMTVPFQNEYLYAALSDSTGSEASQKVVCTVPDLISILGQDGEGIGTQDLRYGLRVSVIALPAHPLWKTEKGLAVGGPEGFGLKMPPQGVDSGFTKARSVIEEFDT